MATTYNSWKNWETWCMYTHITNDEASYYNAREIEEEGEFVHWMEIQLYDMTDDLPPVLKDLLSHAFNVVDWESVFKALKDE